MKKIESLTAEQEVRLKQVLAEWLEIGRSTHVINRDEAEKSITAFYEKIGKKKPMYFWFPSPLQCMLGLAATKLMSEDKNIIGANLRDNLDANLWDNLRANLWGNLRANLSDNLRDNLWDNLRDNLWGNLSDNLSDNIDANLWDNLWANLWDNLRANLDANLWDNLSANLRDNLRANLWGNLRANLWDNIRDNLRTNLSDNLGVIKAWDYFAGNLWCSWEVFYDFCNEIGVPYSQENRHLLDMWLTQSRECHFWWPYENMVFLSERPASVNVDSQGRLHCENDAALYYHDGYGLYMWHGVRVPKWVITEKELITPEKIFAEQNAEVRRIMTEIYGFRKFGDDLIKSGKAKLVDEKTVWDETVKYYHYNDGDATMGFVHVINGTVEADGTKHEFILTVKADNNNAEQAVLSTYPDLMERIGSRPDKWEIIRKSIRS